MACPITAAFRLSLALLNQARRFEASKLGYQAEANLKLRSQLWSSCMPNSARQCRRGGGGSAISGADVLAIRNSCRDTRKRRSSTIGVRIKVYAFQPFQKTFMFHQFIHVFQILCILRLHSVSQNAEDFLAIERVPFLGAQRIQQPANEKTSWKLDMGGFILLRNH